MSITKLGKKLLCFIALFTMIFTLFACENNKNKSNQAEKEAAAKETISKQALNKIFWDPSATKDITSDLKLATEVNGYAITWTSTVPDVIGTNGSVNVPSIDHDKAEVVYKVGSEEVDYYHVPVTLTATASLEYEYTDKNGDTQKATASVTNEYKFTVLCFDGDFGTIAEVKANAYQYIYEEQGVKKELASNSDITYSVGFYGVVTAKLNANGAGQFMVHDGTAGIYVYKSADVEVGDTVYVTGDVYSYYGSLQVGKNIAVKVVEDKGIKVPGYTEKTIDAWEQERAGDNLQNVIGYLGGDRYKLYAKVVDEKNDQTSDAYKLEDPFTGEVAWVYYKSYNEDQEAELKSYVGKYVYITGVTYDRDSRILKNHLLWDGGIEEAEAPVLEDSDKLEIAKKAVLALAGSYAAYSKFELPSENTEVGATISWNIPSDAPYSDGAFLSVEKDTETTFVATIKVGELSEEVEVAITVKKLNALTIDETVKLEVGDVVKLSGTVDVLFSKGYYFLKDATGLILVYVGTEDGIEVNGETKTVKVGDKVEFIGTYNEFNGTPQIKTIIKYTSYEEATWSMSVPTETTIADLCAATINDAPYGQYLMVSGVVVKSGSYYYLAESTAADAKKISLFNSSVPEKVTAVADTDTKVTVFVYYYGNAKAEYNGDVRVVFNGRNGEYFVGDETVVLPEPSVDTVMTELKEGVAYNVALIHKGLENKKLHLTGAMNGYYLATSEHGYEAAKLYVQKVEGGYYLYFLDDETKTYISLTYRDNGGNVASSINVSTDTPSTVWTWDATNNTLVTDVKDGNKFFLGTSSSNTYSTISGANLKYVSSNYVAHFYPASKEVAPDPVVKEEIKTEFDVKSYDDLKALVPEAGKTTEDKYYVAGYVKSIDNPTYGNLTIEDTKGNTWIVYGLYNVDGTVRYDAMTSDKPVVGDAIVVYGVVTNYSGTIETKNGWLVQLGDKVLEAETPDPIVKEEIKTEFDVKSYEELAALVPEAGKTTEEKYYVAGYVKAITSTEYGNMTIEDVDGNTWIVYGLYNVDGTIRFDAMKEDKPKVGDAIVVYGVVTNYNGTKETKNGWLVQLGDKVLEAPVVASNQVVFTWTAKMGVEDADNKTYTISGDGFTIVLDYSKNSQKWDYTSAQMRIYQGNPLTISSTNGKKITKIELTDSHNKNAVLSSSDTGVTVSSEGKAWTFTAEKGVDSVTIDGTAQWRITSITITFAE